MACGSDAFCRPEAPTACAALDRKSRSLSLAHTAVFGQAQRDKVRPTLWTGPHHSPRALLALSTVLVYATPSLQLTSTPHGLPLAPRLCPSNLTNGSPVRDAPVDEELAPRRREPVAHPHGRGCARRCGGQVRPGHGGGVVDVQVLETAACAAEGGVGRTSE